MSYESIVYRILIASPSDVEEEREIVTRIIQDWNDLHSFNKKIVLLPLKWETHSSPTYGVRPQEAINTQIVDDCDMLIGFFWTKIGTPTGKEIGGTVEEIKRVAKAGKPVMLYFSKRGKDPSLIDLKQLEELNKFKEDLYNSALIENFNSLVDFRDKVSRQLEMKIRELQERRTEDKNIIDFSFVQQDNGKFIGNQLKIQTERIEYEVEKIEKLLKSDNRLKDKQSIFYNALVTYVNRKNSIPIVLGVKNNINRTFGNVNVELSLKSSKENSLNIESFNTSEENSLDYNLNELVPYESQSRIRKLFNKSHAKTSAKTWEFQSKPFIMIPDKEVVIEPLILLFPKDSMKIDFNIRLYSENILQTIEANCYLEIKYKERQITNEEISEIITKLPEDDDLPF